MGLKLPPIPTRLASGSYRRHDCGRDMEARQSVLQIVPVWGMYFPAVYWLSIVRAAFVQRACVSSNPLIGLCECTVTTRLEAQDER